MFKYSVYGVVLSLLMGTGFALPEHKEDCESPKTLKIECNPSCSPIYAKPELGTIGLIYDGEKYSVYNNDDMFLVEMAFVDPKLRGLNLEQYFKLLQEGGYIVIKKIGEGEFSLRLMMRLSGGGALGAVGGFFVGKFMTHLVHKGGCALIAACCGPAGPAVFVSLVATTSIPAEIASNKVGWATGMAGMVATGPV